MNNKMRQQIIFFSNLYGSKLAEKAESTWDPITDTELQAYLGLMIIAGVSKSNSVRLSDLWNPERGPPIFSATMSQKRFEKISIVLRFDDKDSRDKNDRFAPIRVLWDEWANTFPRFFSPYENLVIDEELMSFQGRCCFKMYMPSKPNKYGIKFWLLVDCKTHYVLGIIPYLGKPVGQKPEKDLGPKVVIKLCEGLKGYNVLRISPKTTRTAINSSWYRSQDKKISAID